MKKIGLIIIGARFIAGLTVASADAQMGGGRGGGMGMGMGGGMGMGMGRGRGIERGMANRSWTATSTVPQPPAGPTREHDLAELKQAAQDLRQQLAETMDRIDQLDERDDG